MAHETRWQSTRCWVRFLSWCVLGATAYGLAVAHVPAVIGQPWSTCPNLAAVLGVHLFEGPIALFNLFVAWFGLRRLAPDNVRVYDVLLSSLIAINAVFFLFESLLVLDQIRRGAAGWEIWVTGSIVVILLGAVGMGVAIRVGLAGLLTEDHAHEATSRGASEATRSLRDPTDSRRSAVEAS